MRSTPPQSWLWQLSYAILGLGFLIGLFLSIASWGTSVFYLWASISLSSVILLAILSRLLR